MGNPQGTAPSVVLWANASAPDESRTVQIPSLLDVKDEGRVGTCR